MRGVKWILSALTLVFSVQFFIIIVVCINTYYLQLWLYPSLGGGGAVPLGATQMNSCQGGCAGHHAPTFTLRVIVPANPS